MVRPDDLLVHRQLSSSGARQDLDTAIELLQGTRLYSRDPGHPNATPPMLRLYRPEPTVAFGQRDRKLPGYGDAASAARARGYTPLVRRAGGRAAAYHRGSLVIDHIEPDANPIAESRDRFVAFGELLVTALRDCGVDARLGPIPHEYCVGDHSIHAVSAAEPDVRVKIVGTAQRVIGTGWLFSSAIVVEDGQSIRGVLTEVYDALGLAMDPLTAGAAEMVTPGLTVEHVEAAVMRAYARHWRLTDAPDLLLSRAAEPVRGRSVGPVVPVAHT